MAPIVTRAFLSPHPPSAPAATAPPPQSQNAAPSPDFCLDEARVSASDKAPPRSAPPAPGTVTPARPQHLDKIRALVERDRINALLRHGALDKAEQLAIAEEARALGPAAYPAFLALAMEDPRLAWNVAKILTHLGAPALAYLERAIKCEGTAAVAARMLVTASTELHFLSEALTAAASENDPDYVAYAKEELPKIPELDTAAKAAQASIETIELLFEVMGGTFRQQPVPPAVRDEVWAALRVSFLANFRAEEIARLLNEYLTHSSDPVFRGRVALLAIQYDVELKGAAMQAVLEALPALASPLYAADHENLNQQITRAAARAKLSWDAPAARPLLEAMSKTTDSKGKIEAFRIMLAQEPTNTRAWQSMLDDPDPRIRKAVVEMPPFQEGLRSFPMPPYLRHAVFTLSHDHDEEVRKWLLFTLAHTLGELGTRIGELSKIKDPSPEEARELSLAQSQKAMLTELVLERCDDRSPRIREQARQVLLAHFEETHLERMVALLGEESITSNELWVFAFRVSEIVHLSNRAHALPEISTEALRPLLRALHQHPESEQVMAKTIELLSPTPATRLLVPYLESVLAKNPNDARARDLLSLIRRAAALKIEHPFRMSRETLAKVCENRERSPAQGKADTRPVALFFLAKGGQDVDWNAAGYQTWWLEQVIDAGYQVMVYEIGREDEILTAVDDAIAITSAVPAFGGIRGHGTKPYVELSVPPEGASWREHEKHKLDAQDRDIIRGMQRRFRRAARKTRPEQLPSGGITTWIQISCSNGEGGINDRENLAAALAIRGNLRVLAQERIGGLLSIELDPATNELDKAEYQDESSTTHALTEFPAKKSARKSSKDRS